MDDKYAETQAELIDHHVQMIQVASLVVNGEGAGLDMLGARLYLEALRVKVGFFRELLRIMERAEGRHAE